MRSHTRRRDHMSPLRQTASLHSGSSSSEEPEEARQSRRSTSSLNAERAAASSRKSSEDFSNYLRPVQTSESVTASATVLPLPYRRPSTSYIPTTSSPLNSSGRLESDGQGVINEEGRGSGESKSADKRPQPTNPASSGRRPPPIRPIPRMQRRSTSELVHLEANRLSTPLTVRDLGSDYTRYFSPFSNSARSSIASSLTTPLPRYNSTSQLFNSLNGGANPFSTPNASSMKLSVTAHREQNGLLVDDRLAAPYNEKGQWTWPLIGDAAEDDDDMHMPHADDDIKFKPKLRDHFSKGNVASTIGSIMMIIGFLFIFIVLPVLSFTGYIDYDAGYETPLDEMPNDYPKAQSWATVNNKKYPLLENIRSGLIDRDTPSEAMTKTGANGDAYDLVFSDEFNDNNRTFYEGDDPYWFAPDIWYGATQDLDWYDPDAVTTYEGTLELRLDQFPNHGVQYRSAMLNSWNHLCFKGGIFEVSVSLPGRAAVMGLWRGAWTMGNLGRPGYLATTEGLWPYTYNSCDAGITPNQSSYDGLSRLPGQRLNSCTCKGKDHPTPGTGRGAPEIDIFEAGASYGGLPIATQSYQVAPFDIWYYPDYDFTAFPDYSISYTNGYTGGPFQQAISATTNLNKGWYDGNQYQVYSFEYVPGEGEGSYILWKVGNQTTFMIDGRAIGPNGNIQARQVSEEPMSMILNLGFSHSWTEIDFARLAFPTVMRVDYVRWYQKKGETMVTCDPPGFETTQYIREHLDAYTNPNLTHWEQTGHPWPKNKLNTNC